MNVGLQIYQPFADSEDPPRYSLCPSEKRTIPFFSSFGIPSCLHALLKSDTEGISCFAMPLEDMLSSFGEVISDPEEESFLLFSQGLPSQDLGFVDANATALEVSVYGKDLSIRQSPTLLSSNREGGTTGAVVWKITPLFAQWITSDSNILFRSSVLDESSVVLELGSGISGIVAITLARRIGRYIATDQEYVFKLLKANIEDNCPKRKDSGSSSTKHRGKVHLSNGSACSTGKIQVLALDWQSSLVSSLPTIIGTDSTEISQVIGAVIACDCIYNESLSKALFGTLSRLLLIWRSMLQFYYQHKSYYSNSLSTKWILTLKCASNTFRTHMC